MPWVKSSDDEIDDLRTTFAGRHLGPNGIGRAVAVLHEARCYCNRNLTNGYIARIRAKRFVTDLRPLDVLAVLAFRLPPSTKHPDGEPGWMADAEDGWQIVNYLKDQPSREAVLAKREKDARRKAEARAKLREAATDHTEAAHEITLEQLTKDFVRSLPDHARRQLRDPNDHLLELIRGKAARAALRPTTAMLVEQLRRHAR